jgi:hypothetical protein
MDLGLKASVAKAYVVLKEEPIPTPNIHPFAGDDEKQKAYLTGFREGWNFAIRGDILFALHTTPYGLSKNLIQPWNEGWKLGTELGGDRLMAQLHLGQTKVHEK